MGTQVLLQCKYCELNNSFIDDLLFCKNCKQLYHLACRDPSKLKALPKPIESYDVETVRVTDNGQELTEYDLTLPVVPCEECTLCDGCHRSDHSDGIGEVKWTTVEEVKTTTCRGCLPLYDKREFCPVCWKIWKEGRGDDEKMIQCDYHPYLTFQKIKSTQWYQKYKSAKEKEQEKAKEVWLKENGDKKGKSSTAKDNDTAK